MNADFNAFDDARMKFDVRFYLVAILFIIFDLEWRSCSRGRWLWEAGRDRASGRCGFPRRLTVGFAYEWKKGAL